MIVLSAVQRMTVGIMNSHNRGDNAKIISRTNIPVAQIWGDGCT